MPVAEKASPTSWPARYELLDGLRGCAALLVVLNHLGVVNGDVGHCAVMAFFVISGYCIAAATDSAGRNRLGFRQFMARRITRIYPPYLLAVVFFVATRVVKSSISGHNYVNWPVIVWAQNLTLTQWLTDVFHPVVDVIQTPSLFVAAFWSLNYEEQFYLVMALTLLLSLRWGISMIGPVAVLAALGLIWNWLVPGNWMCGFFLEYWAHFALGAFLFFVLSRYPKARAKYLLALALLAITAGARLYLHGTDPSEAMRAMWELAFLSAVTIVLLLLRPFSRRISLSIFWRPFAALGVVSYSLYLIHQFNLTLVASVAHRVIPAGAPNFVLVLAQLILFLALAAGFWWICERPFIPRKIQPKEALAA